MKTIQKFKHKYRCKSGVLNFDMSNMFDKRTISEYKDIEVQVISDKIELPSNMSVGQKLNNSSAPLTNQVVKIMTLPMTISNRKVEAKVIISVPAGTFKYYKISYTFDTKMLFKIKSKAIEWHAKPKIMVKQKLHNDKCKLFYLFI